MIRLLLTLIFTLSIVSACFFLFTKTFYIWSINQARRRGLFPIGRKPTIDDVKRLLKMRERFLAITLYRDMYKLSLPQAQKEVDLLERNLEAHMNGDRE